MMCFRTKSCGVATLRIRSDVVGRTEGPGGRMNEGRSKPMSLSEAQGDGSAWAESLLSAIRDGVALCRLQGEVVWANQTFLVLSDEMKVLVQKTCTEGGAYLARQRRLGSLADGPMVFFRELSAGDPPRHFELHVLPAYSLGQSSAGPVDHVAVVVRDITAAKSLRDRIDRIEQAGSDLVDFESEDVRSKNMIQRLQLLESRIITTAKTLLNFDHFAIRLLDEKTGKLELVIKHNLPPEYDDFEIYPKKEGNGISGWVAATGKSYLCADTSADELYLPGLHQAKSSLTVPLKLHDKILGIMNVESQKSSAFGEDDRRLAEILARYVAIGVHTLGLLVVERSITNKTITQRFASELADPLQDICNEVDVLKQVAGAGSPLLEHIEKIRADVDAIRSRVTEVTEGPMTLLGVEKAMEGRRIDPVLLDRRILVADDQSRIRRIIADVLRNRGALVTVCENGSEAFNELEAAARGERPAFDLVVSDIMMPDKNGYEVFAQARKLQANIPVILMTGFGYDLNHSIVRASQEGLQNVLFKPFQIEQLVDLVKKGLQASA